MIKIINPRILLLSLASLIVFQGISQSYFAQNVGGGNSFATDITGRPLYLVTEYTAKGSPYFYEDYCMADIVTSKGKIYSAVNVKLNLFENSILYKLENGSEMIAETPLKEIRFYNFVHEGTVHPATIIRSADWSSINQKNAIVYEVLVDDSTASLLKQVSISYTDTKSYGESTITRIFSKDESYMALIPALNKEMQKVERNKTALPKLFGEQQTKISEYIRQNKLNCKSQSDLTLVFHYYNTLVK